MAIRNTAHYAGAVLPRAADERTDWEILVALMSGIARRRGGVNRGLAWGTRLFGKALGSGRLLDLLLRSGPQPLSLKKLREAPHGVDLGALQPRAAAVLATADKRIQLVPELLVADLARLDARPGEAMGAVNGKLLLISRRTLRSMNSWLNNSPRLLRGRDRCTLLAHPDDARRLGFDAAQRVRVCSRTGEIQVPLELITEMMPGVVSLPYGWGHDRPHTRLYTARTNPGVSFNDVADEHFYDQVTGTTVLDGIPVTISAV
jgi:anaerobic selenocysteine-containing dehydrogenase